MRIIIHFFALLSLLLTAACANRTIDTGEQTSNAITQTPVTDTSATLIALPAGPNVQTSRIVLQAFFDAYNRHDVEGVLITLAETFAYGDCDIAARHMFVFETKKELAAWLQARFAEGDQFRVTEMIIAPAEGSPANDPHSTAVQVSRTSIILKDQEKQSLFKIILNAEGNRIQYLNTYGNVDCEAGR